MAKQRRALNGRVVAITGGARGIGKATAEALVRRGARVAIGDVDLTLAEQTAAGVLETPQVHHRRGIRCTAQVRQLVPDQPGVARDRVERRAQLVAHGR